MEDTRQIPVEDEDGNLHFIYLSDINYIKAEIPDDPESLPVYHVDGGKVFKAIHTEKAQQELQEFLEKEIMKRTESERP